MSRVRSATWNYLSSLLFAAVSLLAGFIATPFLLRWLGEERFGAYRVTFDWYGYLIFLELGLGGALLPLLARALGKNEKDKLRELLAAGVRAYFGVTLAMLGAGILLSVFINRLVPVKPQYARDLQLGCLIGLIGLLWLPLASPFRAVTDARQRSYWINLLLLVQTVLTTGFALFLAWKNWGITGQFLALVAGGAAFNALLICDGVRRYPGVLPLAFRHARSRSVSVELWKLNTSTYILNICGRVSLLTDNIVVAAILGPVMVVPLVLTQRLAVLVQMQLQGIGNASWAGLAELYARGERETFSQRVAELTRLVCVLGVATLAPIAAFNRHFVSFWVGPGRYGGEAITLFSVFNAFLLGIYSLWGWVFACTGEVRQVVRPLVSQTVLNFFASVLLTRSLGAVGPLVGTFVGFLTVTSWLLPLKLHRTFGVEKSKLTKAVVQPVLVGVPYCAALWILACWCTPRGWLELGMEMLLGAAVYLALVWTLILSPADRAHWLARIRLLQPNFTPATVREALIEDRFNVKQGPVLSENGAHGS
jgi:O-antigen/teichoic acid export membrane protein